MRVLLEAAERMEREGRDPGHLDCTYRLVVARRLFRRLARRYLRLKARAKGAK